MKPLEEHTKDITSQKKGNSIFNGKYFKHFDVVESVCNCGETYESEFKMFTPMDDEIPSVYKSDKCDECKRIEDDERLLQEFREEQKRIKKKRILDRFDSESLLNVRLKSASFEDYNPTNQDLEKAFKLAKRYADNFTLDNPVSLLFIGNYGTGKSHLSVSITKELMKKDFTCIFISTPKLLTKLRSTYNRDSQYTESQIMESLIEVDCLVLDDIGSEQTKQEDANNQSWATSKIFEIMDSRIGKHTIFTSNFEPTELQQRIGGRNFSRMMENTHVIKMYGDDYRLRNFK